MNSNAKRDAVIEKLSKRHCWPNASLADAYEGGFLCGYVARDAEVAELRAQLKTKDEAIDVAVKALEVCANRTECKSYECCASCGPIYEAKEALSKINTLLGREKV